jgi:flavin-dependent dehydrogenase
MTGYDVIVVGARVAGAPTAMLLARMGYRVLVVDRDAFPSDTISTHLIHPPGMAALARWGLAEAVIGTGCPPVTTYRVDFGPFAIVGQPRVNPGLPPAYAPRRTVLDKLLVDAAADGGAEVRESFVVDDLLVEDGAVRGIRGHRRGGRPITERARVVIGADGVNSLVARAVGATTYNEVPAREALYLAYWSGLSTDGEFQLYAREDRGLAAVPTNDGLTVALAAWPIEEFEANRHDLLGNYLLAFQADPAFAERIRRARRESRVVGKVMHNFYRQSFGPGWALVGDAGYHKDAVTAQGISDAFRDAEALAVALDAALSGRRAYDAALADYQGFRDQTTMPMFELTCQMASFEPPSPEEAELFATVAADPSASEDFVSTLAGTMRVEEFFAPDNVQRYFDGRTAVQHADGTHVPALRQA